MASTSSEEIEETIMKEFAIRNQEQHEETCSGISLNLYQLRYNKLKKWNIGHVFHATRKEALVFGEKRIEEPDLDNRRDSVFLVEELSERVNLEDRMERALRVKHKGILKLRMVSYNPQISKMISGYGICHCSFADWLGKQPISKDANASYLSAVQKEIIRTVYLAIEHISAMNLSSDVLQDPNSYVMGDTRIMILDSCLRSKNGGETVMMLRDAFANMLITHILPKWLDEEIRDFAALLKNPIASGTDIMGHPILLTPVERELLYHEFDDSKILTSVRKNLVNKLPLSDKWQSNIRTDLVVNDIFNHQLVQQTYANHILRMPIFSFTNDPAGAFHLGAVMSAHYTQHAQKRYPDWTSNVRRDTVDLLLKVHLRRLLTRRYGLKFNNKFRALR